MGDKITLATMAIGGIAFMPVVITGISGILKARRERRRARMFNRFNDRMGI